MTLVTPFWFKQRQAKVEEAGPDLYKVSGPNLKEGFIGIRQAGDGRWLAFLRDSANGEDVAATAAELQEPYDAWGAAFEIYRNHKVI